MWCDNSRLRIEFVQSERHWRNFCVTKIEQGLCCMNLGSVITTNKLAIQWIVINWIKTGCVGWITFHWFGNLSTGAEQFYPNNSVIIKLSLSVFNVSMQIFELANTFIPVLTKGLMVKVFDLKN